MKEYNKPLIIFASIYTLISIYFVIDLNNRPGSSVGYLLIFPVFWFFGVLTFGLLYFLTEIKIEIKTKLDRIAMLFSTPIPMLVFWGIWFTIKTVKQN